MITYLKKVQKLQQALMGKRTVYLMTFTHLNDKGSRTNIISFDIKNGNGDFESFGFYDYDSEDILKATYERLCARLRELGHNV